MSHPPRNCTSRSPWPPQPPRLCEAASAVATSMAATTVTAATASAVAVDRGEHRRTDGIGGAIPPARSCGWGTCPHGLSCRCPPQAAVTGAAGASESGDKTVSAGAAERMRGVVADGGTRMPRSCRHAPPHSPVAKGSELPTPRQPTASTRPAAQAVPEASPPSPSRPYPLPPRPYSLSTMAYGAWQRRGRRRGRCNSRQGAQRWRQAGSGAAMRRSDMRASSTRM